MLQIAAGDQEAFRVLFDTYRIQLYSFAEGLVRSAADAEEIIQDVFTVFWMNRASAGTIQNPGSYLYSMVRNRCIDHLRKTARDKKLMEQLWALSSNIDSSMQERLSGNDSLERIEVAVAALPEQKQRIFRLSKEQGYSHEEIADLTGLSKSRVNNILVESLKYVKQMLQLHSGELALIFWITSWDRIFL